MTRSAFRAAICSLLAPRLAAVGKPRFVIQSFAAALSLDALAALFPNARFLLMVRDPRAVAGSLLRCDWRNPRDGQRLPYTRDPVAGTRLWMDFMNAALPGALALQQSVARRMGAVAPDDRIWTEFRLRSDMALHGMPGEHLLPFEGAGFTTTWTLVLPKAANALSLNRVTDVRITFDVQAAYEVPSAVAPAAAQPVSRAVFVSALALDSTGLKSLRDAAVPQGKLTFDLHRLALPADAVITNLAVLLPGVVGGTINATLRFGTSAATAFQIDDGLAMSNAGVLSDGNPANVQPLNAAVAGSPARPATVTISKGTAAARLAAARDALLWVEYRVP
jgi:hypothetical protein